MNAFKTGEIPGIFIQFKLELCYFTRKAKIRKPLDINFIRRQEDIIGVSAACLVLFSKGIDYD